jgi:hypothetical protein
LLELASARFGPLTLFHRLDRDTSGVLLLTRGGAINALLTQAFQAGLIVKEYNAVVTAPNRLGASGVIEARLRPSPQRRDCMEVTAKGGQRAVTRYTVLATTDDRAWVHFSRRRGGNINCVCIWLISAHRFLATGSTAMCLGAAADAARTRDHRCRRRSLGRRANLQRHCPSNWRRHTRPASGRNAEPAGRPGSSN